MKLYPSAAGCCPDADQTVETAIVERRIPGPSNSPHFPSRVKKRAKRIWHRYGSTWRWHWSDQDIG